MSAEPVVFISHKQSDRGIAEALAWVVKNQSAGARSLPPWDRGTESRQKGPSWLPNSLEK